MRRAPAPIDFDGWVAQLAVAHRRRDAKWHLSQAGPAAVPALRRGLRHRDAIVRGVCAAVLDRLADDEALDALVVALGDDEPAVVGRALHALACERCKENGCTPVDARWVPRALELARTHPSPDVRASALDALGRVVARRPDVGPALLTAAEGDPHPGVRNMARIRARSIPERASG